MHLREIQTEFGNMSLLQLRITAFVAAESAVGVILFRMAHETTSGDFKYTV